MNTYVFPYVLAGTLVPQVAAIRADFLQDAYEEFIANLVYVALDEEDLINFFQNEEKEEDWIRTITPEEKTSWISKYLKVMVGKPAVIEQNSVINYNPN